ncbi:MAG: response regulator [Armatimonadetes bacterium]|nr:response regulator [Armatimonadota bacterium]
MSAPRDALLLVGTPRVLPLPPNRRLLLARSLEEALDLTRQERPEMALLDLDEHPPEWGAGIRSVDPDVAVILLARSDHHPIVVRALREFAQAYFLKDLDPPTRLEWILGGAVPCPGLTGRRLHDLRSPMSAVLGYAETLLEGLLGPLRPEQEQALQRLAARVRELQAALTGPRAAREAPTILVVDDDPDVLALFCRYLEHQGFRCRQAESKKEALERAAAHRPDLVVLDVSLPDGDGLELCRTLRSRWELPVLLTSGYTATDEQLRQAGALEWLSKPFPLADLGAAVRRFLPASGPARPSEHRGP